MRLNDLYQKAASGDTSAESQLFSDLTVSFRLFAQQRIGNKEEISDIVQTALEVVARKYRDIEFDVSFAAWAQRVFHNTLLDTMRTKQRRSAKLAEWADTRGGEAMANPDPMLRSQLVECFRKLCRANLRYARALNFCYQGYDSTEVGQRMGISVGNLYVMLSRARSLLELCLEKGDIR